MSGENYTDKVQWPSSRLNNEIAALQDSLKTIDHVPERVEQIKASIGQKAFELYCRYQEGESQDGQS